MCQFLSWIEKDNKIYFLIRKQVDSPQGEILKKRFPGEGELVGHEAIRAFYEIDNGVEKECIDFSTPDNFPDIILKAIKKGEFKGFPFPKGLLRKPLYDDYRAKWKSLYDDYEAKCKSLDDDYKAKWKSLYDGYEAKWKSLYDDYWDLFAFQENRASQWK